MKLKAVSMALALSVALFHAPTPAQAADGQVCYGPVWTVTQTASTTTVNYPQLENTTAFTCLNATGSYTIRRLSQLGWIIVSVQPSLLSSSTNSATATVTTRTRMMLVIQR